MRRAVMASLFVLLAMFFACAIYGPSLLETVEAGTDAPMPPPMDAGPPCDSATWPGRPAMDDPATYDGGEFLMAIQQINFDPDAGGGTITGYDLDRACTCPGKPSCLPSGDAKVVCDDPNGRDNSGGLLLASFSAFASELFDSAKINMKIQLGQFNFLIRVKDYNGAKNDTQVAAALFVSNGMKGIEDGGKPTVPKFDGNDEWTVDPGSLFGGTGPPFVPLPDSVDTMAYVTNGMLVAMINQARLQLSGNSVTVTLDLSGAVLTGHLTPANGVFEMKDGVIAGRWPSRRLLVSLSVIKDTLNPGSYLCGDSSTYANIKQLICNERDIVAALQNDNTNAYCDSLSVAFAFNAPPAKFGNPVSKSAALAPCGAGWDDDCSK